MGKISAVKDHRRSLESLLRDNARRHRLHKVFSDFTELSALALSNAVDLRQREKREARYMQIVADYERPEVERFAHMFGVLTDWLSCGMHDCLGELFMSLELSDHWKGQFFTPSHICELMAGLTLGDAPELIRKSGFVTLHEPACGAGAMVIGMAKAIQDRALNYQQSMHVTAVDLDSTAAHMAYVQLSLLHIPAIVVRGNTLTMQFQENWITPAHILGGWDRRLRDRQASKIVVPENFSEAEACMPAPVSVAPMQEDAMPADVHAKILADRLEQLALF